MIHETLKEVFSKLMTGLKEGSPLESVNLRIGDYTLNENDKLGKAMRQILSENLAKNSPNQITGCQWI